MSSERIALNDVTLEVDGKPIFINPYVEDVFSEVVRALVSTLRKDSIPEEYEELKLVIRSKS